MIFNTVIYGGGGDEVEAILVGTAPSIGDKVLLLPPSGSQPRYKQFVVTAFTTTTSIPTGAYTGVLQSVSASPDDYGNTIATVATALIEADKDWDPTETVIGFDVTIARGGY